MMKNALITAQLWLFSIIFFHNDYIHEIKTRIRTIDDISMHSVLLAVEKQAFDMLYQKTHINNNRRRSNLDSDFPRFDNDTCNLLTIKYNRFWKW